MLDGICTGVNRGLYTGLIERVDGNLEVLAVRLFDYRPKFRDREILIRRNLDEIDVLELVLPDCLPCTVCSVDQQEFLLQDSVGKSRD